MNNIMNNPFNKDWQPFDKDTIVSVRSVEIFGDNEIRRGRVQGWHISSGLNDDRRDPFEEPEPKLEYNIKFFKTQTSFWVPAENLMGFVRGV